MTDNPGPDEATAQRAARSEAELRQLAALLPSIPFYLAPESMSVVMAWAAGEIDALRAEVATLRENAVAGGEGCEELRAAAPSTSARLIGPMTRRIGQLGITLRRLVEAIERDDGVDMTPLWEQAREVLADNSIIADAVDSSTRTAAEVLNELRAATTSHLSREELPEYYAPTPEQGERTNGECQHNQWAETCRLCAGIRERRPLHGCTCGKRRLLPGVAEAEHEQVLHRVDGPCYWVDGLSRPVFDEDAPCSNCGHGTADHFRRVGRCLCGCASHAAPPVEEVAPDLPASTHRNVDFYDGPECEHDVPVPAFLDPAREILARLVALDGDRIDGPWLAELEGIRYDARALIEKEQPRG